MASNTKNVKLGVCKIFFDGQDLGYTQGGVEFSVQTMTHKVEVDQFGKTAINETIIGREAKVKAPLAETTLQNLAAIMPSFNAGLEGITNQRVGVDAGIGVDLLASAKMLVLHPKGLKDWDYSEEIVIPLANTPGSLNFAYKLEDERIFNVDFQGYPDPVSDVLFYAGNPFTDATGKSFVVTTAAGSVVSGFTGLTEAHTGKMVMVGTDEAGVLSSPLKARKLYFLKYVSATTASLHNSYEDALAGLNAVTFAGAGTAQNKLALLS